MNKSMVVAFRHVIWAALVAVLAVRGGVAVAAEPVKTTIEAKRKPAEYLRAERSAILFMEGRELLERPEEILDKMNLADGDLVADLGCGPGYYALRLARRVGPHGVVFAVDIQPGMLDQLSERIAEAKATNIYPVLGELDDPHLPPGKIDWVLLVDAYHEFGEPVAMLRRIRDCLAPGGRVALLEYRAEQDPATLPVPIPRDHKMTIEEVMVEWTAGGFELVDRLEFLPAQHYFIFKKAGDATAIEPEWHVGGKISELKIGSVVNASRFGDRVYFGGQPKVEDFNTFSVKGVKTVINLRTAPEMTDLGFDESGVVEKAGMQYVHVPIGQEPPSGDDLRLVMAALEGAKEGAVLLHCASSNRVGYVWSIYRALHHGLSIESAIREGQAAGMRSGALEKRARETILKPWPAP
jgi:uncharacterized protein (TIGR01244 family)